MYEWEHIYSKQQQIKLSQIISFQYIYIDPAKQELDACSFHYKNAILRANVNLPRGQVTNIPLVCSFYHYFPSYYIDMCIYIYIYICYCRIALICDLLLLSHGESPADSSFDRASLGSDLQHEGRGPQVTDLAKERYLLSAASHQTWDTYLKRYLQEKTQENDGFMGF